MTLKMKYVADRYRVSVWHKVGHVPAPGWNGFTHVETKDITPGTLKDWVREQEKEVANSAIQGATHDNTTTTGGIVDFAYGYNGAPNVTRLEISISPYASQWESVLVDTRMGAKPDRFATVYYSPGDAEKATERGNEREHFSAYTQPVKREYRVVYRSSRGGLSVSDLEATPWVHETVEDARRDVRETLLSATSYYRAYIFQDTVLTEWATRTARGVFFDPHVLGVALPLTGDKNHGGVVQTLAGVTGRFEPWHRR
jgi:hypothetical protein